MRLITQLLLTLIVFIQLHGLSGEIVYVNVDDITTFTRVAPGVARPNANTHLHLLNAEALFVTDTPEEVWKKVRAGIGHD
jgi:hypothetical protein